MTPRAIETKYKGHRFRSRTEARWAVFMDALHVRWEYEKEGFDLGGGVWYLPDFWLPEHDCWLEVKGQSLTDEERRKVELLASQSGKLVFVFYNCGPFVLDRDYEEKDVKLYGGGHYFAPDGDMDGLIEFGFCEACRQVTIGQFGGHDVMLCDQRFERKTDCPDTKKASSKHPKIDRAFTATRSARFEHGESPQV